MSNHVKQRDYSRGGSRAHKVPRNRSKRVKTFKTEQAAREWAEQNGIQDYVIQDLKPFSEEKKLRVIPTE